MLQKQCVDHHQTSETGDGDEWMQANRAAQHHQQGADRQAPGDRKDHQPVGSRNRLENEGSGKIGGR
ncbi:hypothetical protein D3C86_2233920 [compost metagenome]